MNPERTLEDLIRLPAEARSEWLRAVGPLEKVVPDLSAAVEKLALTRVDRAVEAGEALAELTAASCGALERARALRAYAQALAYAGRFLDAAPVFEDAKRAGAEAGDRHEHAVAELASIHALVHLARYEEALAAGESALSVFLETNDRNRAGRAETSLGGVCQKLDDQAAALEHFDRARALLHDDAIALAQLESNRGLALHSRGDLAAAEAAFHAALPAFEGAQLDWACAIVEGNLALLAARQGRIQTALFYFERERRHLERDAAPAELARALVDQADSLAGLRLLREAETDYREALPMLEQHGQVREALQARAGLGRVLALRGRAEAEPLLIAAADAYERMGQSAERARLATILSEIRLEAGQPESARALAQSALAALRDRPVDAAVARYHLGRAALASGDLATAAREIDVAVRAATALGITPLLADLLRLRAQVCRSQGDARAALSDLEHAVGLVERVRTTLQAERFRAAFHANRLAAYGELVALALDHATGRSWGLAFETIERAKSRALLDNLHGSVETVSAASAPTTDDAEAALADDFSRLHGELSAAYSQFADRQTSGKPVRHAAAARISELEERIAAMESRLATTRGVTGLHARPIRVEDLQRELAPDAALVEYFEANGELLALVVTPDARTGFRRLSDSATMNERVQRLRFQIGRSLRPGAVSGRRAAALLADTRRELEALHAMLLAPLRDALVGVQRLLFVPHGALHAVPLHALWDGRRHVLESHSVSYGPSASVLTRMRRRSSAGRGQARALVLGFADERAPRIEDEARRVAETLSAAELLLGPAATTSSFAALAPRAALLHLACHGSFSSDHPLGSGIRLADRWLTVKEIYALALQADLVTLAACETGRNVIASGDELVGLTRGFIAAGAAALVVSLWIVNDEVSGTLMGRFYNELGSARDGAATAQALRAAQLAAMSARPHPAFWAPFIHIGGL